MQIAKEIDYGPMQNDIIVEVVLQAQLMWIEQGLYGSTYRISGIFAGNFEVAH